MINVKILCVGNLKEKFWIDACEEYKKRLSKFCKLKIIELDELNKYNEPAKILQKEGEELLKHLGANPVLMAIEGKELSSEEFATFIEQEKLSNSEITFVIGSSYGVSEDVKKVVKRKLSFGKATFPHNLARVMLLEQIYRAFMLSSGAKYHK